MKAAPERLYLRSLPERVWHGIHTLSFLGLILSGINLRFPADLPLLGLKNAVALHNVCAKVLLADYALWLVYVLLSRRLKFLLPGRRDLARGLLKQGKYYLRGVLRGDAPPFPATGKDKFNPLQKWTYLAVMAGLVPLLIVSGIGLVMPERVNELTGDRVHLVALVHRFLAYLATAFVIAHVYLAVTAPSIRSTFGSMVTGWVEAGSFFGHKKAQEDSEGN
jgi:thiosulfate reductase cytochrome b subunit